ncbi:ribosomal protein, putative [Ichthyophthirius multifiliis]|uniref:40S ribosomal protein S4 n=1 Tax=Ichthyophthirius multifiliis TaxID=5932 RepID=G0QJG3_ICHMU|nr:ribosomal protein, putative [Ichthyophthirius multifiliis]EGR34650.1 ribosomal protein, putative [Ichthyophthirius multifiliis]|eukprot:XP_004039954.1 ribosomal protein, putative [Ichthyophthirius multifiliis]
MVRGPKKHLKRICAPKSWMISKLGGIWVTRPSQGPHKLRESLPLFVLLKNRLNYALNGRDVTLILNDKEQNVFVDGKCRRDRSFPTGLMDVVSIPKTDEQFRVLYDTKGRFVLKTLNKQEAQFKLLKVKGKAIGPNQVPYIVTHDSRTIRFPNPNIKIGDTIKYDIVKNKILEFAHLESGNICFVQNGNNIGRVGLITHIEKHPGSFDIVHVKDTKGNSFATRIGNIFVIGQGKKPWVSLPEGDGIYETVMEQRQRKFSH